MITRHALKRAAQRGVKWSDLHLISRYGSETPKGFILTRKDFKEAEREAKHLLDRLSHLVGKFVATDNDTAITVFHATERQRRAQMK